MAEIDLWDGNTATRKRFMSRTFSWDTTPATINLTGQIFIDTTLKGLYQWDGTQMVPVMFSEDENIAHIMALV